MRPDAEDAACGKPIPTHCVHLVSAVGFMFLFLKTANTNHALLPIVAYNRFSRHSRFTSILPEIQPKMSFVYVQTLLVARVVSHYAPDLEFGVGHKTEQIWIDPIASFPTEPFGIQTLGFQVLVYQTLEP